MHWHDHWWSWHGMGMGLFWILVAAAVIAAIVWAVRSSGGSSRDGPRGESPEETLKRRYARGDISREEYERTLSDLRR